MLPFVGVPTAIAKGMSAYRDVFGREEGFEHVSRYVSGLRLSENKTLQGIDAQQSILFSPILRRFYGSVDLDAMRLNRDAPTIANEVIQHLTALHGATVKITLEIEAEIPDGVPDNVIRTVTENCNTLRFKSRSFEPE